MVDCDFVEDTEYGPYCCYERCACHSEDCELIKYGLGEEDIEQAVQALYEIKSNMNR